MCRSQEERFASFMCRLQAYYQQAPFRKSWLLPNTAFYLSAVGGAKYITVADVMSVLWPNPVAAEDVEKTAFVTPSGKHVVVLRMAFGVMSTP